MHNKKYIDVNGTPHLMPDGGTYPKDALAYIIGDMCFVLASNDGDLFNVQDIYLNRNKKDLEKGGNFYTLKRCDKVCFDYYIMFLQTKNKTHLTLAQRSYSK